MAHWKTAVTLFFVAALLAMSAHAQESDSTFGQSLILNVYLDNAGKALVTGYAEDVSGLAFLEQTHSSGSRTILISSMPSPTG